MRVFRSRASKARKKEAAVDRSEARFCFAEASEPKTARKNRGGVFLFVLFLDEQEKDLFLFYLIGVEAENLSKEQISQISTSISYLILSLLAGMLLWLGISVTFFGGRTIFLQYFLTASQRALPSSSPL